MYRVCQVADLSPERDPLMSDLLVTQTAIWAVCSVASYFMLKRAWLGIFDFTTHDRAAIAAISLLGGPAALLPAVVLSLPLPKLREPRVLVRRDRPPSPLKEP
jgi:hypothetical protein